MKTLNIRIVKQEELKTNWGFVPPYLLNDGIFIRCNAKGEVNWDKAPVYTLDEIRSKQKVVFHL